MQNENSNGLNIFLKTFISGAYADDTKNFI